MWGQTSQAWIQNQMPLWKILCIIHPNTSLHALPSRKLLIMTSHQEVLLAFSILSFPKNSKAHLCIHPELQTFLLNTEPQPLNQWPPRVQIRSRETLFQTWSCSKTTNSTSNQLSPSHHIQPWEFRFWKSCQKENVLLNFSGLQSGTLSVKWKEFITHCRGDVASMRELCEMLNRVPAS